MSTALIRGAGSGVRQAGSLCRLLSLQQLCKPGLSPRCAEEGTGLGEVAEMTEITALRNGGV